MIYYSYFYKRMKVSHLVPYNDILECLVYNYKNANVAILIPFIYDHQPNSKSKYKQQRLNTLVDMFLSKSVIERAELWG